MFEKPAVNTTGTSSFYHDVLRLLSDIAFSFCIITVSYSWSLGLTPERTYKLTSQPANEPKNYNNQLQLLSTDYIFGVNQQPLPIFAKLRLHPP